MIRKVISIIFYIFSGFCFFTTSSLLFFSHEIDEIIALLIIFVVGLVIYFVGLLFSGLKNWKRDLGITWITVASVGIFDVITLYCLYFEPTFRNAVPDFYNDFSKSTLLQGTCYLLLIGTFGSLLLWWNRDLSSKMS